MTAGPALRWGRAAVLAAVVLLAGALAHLSADGLLPGPLALATMYAATTATCASLLGRPASTRRVVAMLVGGQTLVHVVLTGLSGHRGDGVVTTRATVPSAALAPPSGGRAGSYFDVVYGSGHAAAGTPVLPAFAQHVAADLTGHLGAQVPMALAHLAAAVVVGLWLAAGERALWLLVAVVVDAPGVAARLVASYAMSARRVLAAAASLRQPRPVVDLLPPLHLLLPARWAARRGPPTTA